MGLAFARAATGETAVAQAALRKLLGSIRRPILTTAPRARVHLKLADRLIALLPRHPLAYAERGSHHFAFRNRNGAIRDFERGLALCKGVHALYAPTMRQLLSKAHALPRQKKR